MATVRMTSSAASRPSVQRVAARSPSGIPMYKGANAAMAAVCNARPLSEPGVLGVVYIADANDTVASASVMPAIAASTGRPGIATTMQASAHAPPAAGFDTGAPARAA